MGIKVAQFVGGRRIWQHDPIGLYAAPWYSVEVRGPLFEGVPLELHTGAFGNLADANAEAERLGPMADDLEISN